MDNKDLEFAEAYLEEMQKHNRTFPYEGDYEASKENLSDETFLRKHYEYFQQKYPDLDFDMFKEQIKQMYSFKNPLLANSKYQSIQWLGILSSLLNNIEPVIKERYNRGIDKVLFGTMPIGPINGYAIQVPDSSYKLILLSEGIFGFAHLLTKALSSLFLVQDEKGQAIGNAIDKAFILKRLDNAETVSKKVYDLVMAFAVYADPFKTSQYLESKDLEVFLMSELRSAMETFILAHECGHILHGHLDDRYVEVDNENRIMLKNLQEFEADNIGVNICMDVFVKRKIGTAIGFAGADFFFCSMHFFEKCFYLLRDGKIKDNQNTKSTHPPFKLRRKTIRISVASLKDNNEKIQVLDFADTLEKILDILFYKLTPFLIVNHSRGVRPSDVWNKYYG